MKRAIVGLSLALLLAGLADDYDDTQSHPLRIAAYLLHPVGFTAEWLIFRPLHYLVSRPGLERVFGHRPHSENRAF